MAIAFQGTYQNGRIKLNNKPAFKTKQNVTILFEFDTEPATKRVFGSLKGKISVPDNFDEPLEDLKEYMF